MGQSRPRRRKNSKLPKRGFMGESRKYAGPSTCLIMTYSVGREQEQHKREKQARLFGHLIRKRLIKNVVVTDKLDET